MTMPNWLIPTGEILFSGDEPKLKALIGSLNGTLREGGVFTCKLGGGAFSFRFKMPTVFRCTYARAEGGLRITWRACPGIGTGLLLAALLLVVLAGAVSARWELAGYLLCLLGMLAFLYLIQRGNAVEQFREKFSG